MPYASFYSVFEATPDPLASCTCLTSKVMRGEFFESSARRLESAISHPAIVSFC